MRAAGQVHLLLDVHYTHRLVPVQGPQLAQAENTHQAQTVDLLRQLPAWELVHQGPAAQGAKVPGLEQRLQPPSRAAPAPLRLHLRI